MSDFDVVVTGNIVTPNGVLSGGFLAVRGTRIERIGRGQAPAAREKIDASGAWIFPGAIDAQVHSRTQKGQEGFAYSTKAAAAGGVTTIVDMPYDEGALVCSASAVQAKAAEINALAHVDVALYGTIHPDEGTSRINEQIEAGVCAFKFSTFGTHPVRFPRIPPYLMKDAFIEIARSGLAAGVHNENHEVVVHDLAEVKRQGITTPQAHGLSHSPFAEVLAIAEIYEIAAYTGCRGHVVHCSVGRGYELCEAYKRQGIDVSIEACIHYLCFNEEEDVCAKGGLAKINPPIRSKEEQEQIWKHFAAGHVDLVSTDHVAWSRDRKNDPDMLNNASGSPGLEVLLPMLIKGCVARGIDLSMVARTTSANVARHFCLGPRKGALMPGNDADFCIIEPTERPFDVANSQTVVDWSLYDGITMPTISATYVRGNVVWDGKQVVVPSGYGEFVKPHGRF